MSGWLGSRRANRAAEGTLALRSAEKPHRTVIGGDLGQRDPRRHVAHPIQREVRIVRAHNVRQRLLSTSAFLPRQSRPKADIFVEWTTSPGPASFHLPCN